jgi:hypothetical protein
MKMITIDDGTDCVSFWTPKQMIDGLVDAATGTADVDPGLTLDCILKLRQSGSTKRWFAETIIHITNPIEEHLRWIIMSHQKSVEPNHRQEGQLVENSKQPLSYDFGCPTLKRDVKDVFRFIRLHVQIQQQQHKENRYNYNRQSSIRNSAVKAATTPTSFEGINLDDLALVLRKSKSIVQEMVHDLQLQGRIYQNEKGEYLPL